MERRWHDWSEWGACRWDVELIDCYNWIFEFCVFLKNHLCYSAACGLGSRTRRRSAVGEEGFEVLCFFLELGLSKVLFLSR